VISRTLALMGAQIIVSPCAWAVPADHDQAREPYGALWRGCYGGVAATTAFWIAGASNVGPITAGAWAGGSASACSLSSAPKANPSRKRLMVKTRRACSSWTYPSPQHARTIESRAMPITILGLFIIAVAVQFSVALSFYPALSWSRAQRRPLAILVIVLIALTPLSLPATARFPRFLSAVIAIALMVKLYDLHRTCGPSVRPTLGAYIAYLPNWLSCRLAKLHATPQPRVAKTRAVFTRADPGCGCRLIFVWVVRLIGGLFHSLSNTPLKCSAFFFFSFLSPRLHGALASAVWTWAGPDGPSFTRRHAGGLLAALQSSRAAVLSRSCLPAHPRFASSCCRHHLCRIGHHS
jgi:hypothetical protein